MLIGQISQFNLLAKKFSKVDPTTKTDTQNGNNGQQQKQKGYVYRNPKDEHAKGQLIDYVC
jgi:hypothetical protein